MPSAATCLATRGNSRVGDTEVDLVGDIERAGETLAQQRRDGVAGRPAKDLAEQEPEGLGVVAQSGPGLPPQLGVGDEGAHGVPVAEIRRGRFGWETRDTSGVKEHVAQRHLVLPAGPELRPHVDDAQVVGDLTAFDEDVRHRGRHPLRGGTGPEQGVAIDGRSGARIGCTACRVDERVTVPDDRDLHPDLPAGTDHVIEEGVDGGGKLVFTHVDDSDDRRPSNSSLSRTPHVGDRPTASATAGSGTHVPSAARRRRRPSDHQPSGPPDRSAEDRHRSAH